jgi:hypothetical protein
MQKPTTCHAIIVCLAAALFTCAVNAQPVELRVDGDNGLTIAQGATGLDWTHAFEYLQDAIKEADDNPNDDHRIWVRGDDDSNGVIYYPDEGANLPSVSSAREHTFHLRNNIQLLGGFDGDETSYQERNPAVYKTILSGDIQQNDPTITDNSFHVVTGERLGVTAVIDGFTIKAGNANGEDVWVPTCSGIDCPDEPGGCDYELDPALDGKIGGGMLLLGVPQAGCGACQPLVLRCKFEGNRAGKKGGGVYFAGNPGSHPIFSNCQFIGNESETGAGFANDTGNTGLANCTLMNCLFVDNTATQTGAAVWVRATNGAGLINCTVADNTSGTSGAAVSSSEACAGLPRQTMLSLVNSIVFDNQRTGGSHVEAQIAGFSIISYCCIEGFDVGDPDTFCLNGGDNTDDDPVFIGSGDYRLSSTSPVTVVDAGLSATIINQDDLGDIDQDGDALDIAPDLAALQRLSSPNCCLVDMGAYERQVTDACPADADRDCDVDVDDLVRVILEWGSDCPCPADVHPTRCNGNREVDADDLTAVILAWGACTGCVGCGEGAGVDIESYEDCLALCGGLDIECMQA